MNERSTASRRDNDGQPHSLWTFLHSKALDWEKVIWTIVCPSLIQDVMRYNNESGAVCDCGILFGDNYSRIGV
jgi:hypothetical protein